MQKGVPWTGGGGKMAEGPAEPTWSLLKDGLTCLVKSMLHGQILLLPLVGKPVVISALSFRMVINTVHGSQVIEIVVFTFATPACFNIRFGACWV